MKRIVYLLDQFPLAREDAIAVEIREMSACGHPILPIILAPAPAGAEKIDPELDALAIYLENVCTGKVLDGLSALGSAHAERALTYIRHQTQAEAKSLLWNGAKIAGLVRRHRCTHIHAHIDGGAAAHAIVAARLAGITVSFVADGAAIYDGVGDLELMLNSADFAITACDEIEGALRVIAPQARVHRTNCPVDLELFRPASDLVRHNGRLLYCGPLTTASGLGDLLEALAAIPMERRPGLDIVGDGVARAAFEAAAYSLGLGGGVRFFGLRCQSWLTCYGPTYRGVVAPFSSAANVRDNVGPRVVKQAMAMGLPVIAARFNGLREMVTPQETGWLVDAGDIGALYVAIESLCALDHFEWRRMSRQARSRASALFSVSRQVNLLSNLVEVA